MSKTSKKAPNGVQALAPELEEQRQTVVELELKARYWKAQFEIMDYSLRADSIESAYTELIQRQKEQAEKQREEFLEQIEKMKKTAGFEVVEPENVEGLTPEVSDSVEETQEIK